MGRLGRATLISAPDQQGRKQIYTTIHNRRTYCFNIYCQAHAKVNSPLCVPSMARRGQRRAAQLGENLKLAQQQGKNNSAGAFLFSGDRAFLTIKTLAIMGYILLILEALSEYRKVDRSRQVYYSILDHFVQRSQYISIKIPLYEQSENPWVCY